MLDLPVEDVILNKVIFKVGVLRSKAGGYEEERQVNFWGTEVEGSGRISERYGPKGIDELILVVSCNIVIRVGVM